MNAQKQGLEALPQNIGGVLSHCAVTDISPKKLSGKACTAGTNNEWFGEHFMIFAVKLGTMIVSRYDPQIKVGYPYLVIIYDAMSEAYVGYGLSLRRPDWALTASALQNSEMSKDIIFRRLGLNNERGSWPCHHRPSRLTSESVDLMSNMTWNVHHFGIILEASPPMRSHPKGRLLNAINRIINKRRAKNRNLNGTCGCENSAGITLEELEKIVVVAITQINNEQIASVKAPPEMLKEGGVMTRIGLYEWGIQHKEKLINQATSEEITPDPKLQS